MILKTSLTNSFLYNKQSAKSYNDRSRLRSKFLNAKSQECKQAYNKQRNFCVTMVRKAKRNFYNNLNIRNITDNKQFWKTVKPRFLNTFGDNERIKLIEGEKVVSEDREVTKTFQSYFETIVKNLGINSKFMSEDPVSNESVNDVIRKFQNHPSIIKIKENHQGHSSFSAVEV